MNIYNSKVYETSSSGFQVSHATSEEQVSPERVWSLDEYGCVQKLLFESGLTDKEGRPVEALRNLPLPLLSNDEKRLFTKLLEEEFFSTSVSDLLVTLNKLYPLKCLQIFGSSVLKTLGPDYIFRCLKAALEHVGGNSNLLNEFKKIKIDTQQTDIDIRCKFKNYFPNILKSTIDEIIAIIASRNQCGTDFVKQKAFDKLRVPKPEEKNQFGIWSIGFFDVLHVVKFKRKAGIHTTGSIYVDIWDLVKGDFSGDAYPKSELGNAWTGLFDLLQGIMRPSDNDQEEADWIKSHVGYVRGYSHYDTKFLGVVPSKESLVNLLKKAHSNHFRERGAEGVAFVIQALQSLQCKYSEEELKEFATGCKSIWDKGPKIFVKKLNAFADGKLTWDNFFVWLLLTFEKQSVFDNLSSKVPSVKIKCGKKAFINLKWSLSKIKNLPPINHHTYLPFDFREDSLREKGLSMIDSGDYNGLNLYLFSLCFQMKAALDWELVQRLPKFIGKGAIKQISQFFQLNGEFEKVDNPFSLIKFFCQSPRREMKKFGYSLLRNELTQTRSEKKLLPLCLLARDTDLALGFRAFNIAAKKLVPKMRVKQFFNLVQLLKKSRNPNKFVDYIVKCIPIVFNETVKGFLPKNLERDLVWVLNLLKSSGHDEAFGQTLNLISDTLSFDSGSEMMPVMMDHCKELDASSRYLIWHKLEEKSLWQEFQKLTDYFGFLANLTHQLYQINSPVLAKEVLSNLMPLLKRPIDSELRPILNQIGTDQESLLASLWETDPHAFAIKLEGMKDHLCIRAKARFDLKIKLINEWIDEKRYEEAAHALKKMELKGDERVFEVLSYLVGSLINHKQSELALKLLKKMNAHKHTKCLKLYLQSLNGGYHENKIHFDSIIETIEGLLDFCVEDHLKLFANFTIDVLSNEIVVTPKTAKMLLVIAPRLVKHLDDPTYFKFLHLSQFHKIPFPNNTELMKRALFIAKNKVGKDPSGLVIAGYLQKQKVFKQNELINERKSLNLSLFVYHSLQNHFSECFKYIESSLPERSNKHLINFLEKLCASNASLIAKQLRILSGVVIELNFQHALFWSYFIRQAAVCTHTKSQGGVFKAALKVAIPNTVIAKDDAVMPDFYLNLCHLMDSVPFKEFHSYLDHFLKFMKSVPSNEKLLNARYLMLERCKKEVLHQSDLKIKAGLLFYPFTKLTFGHPLYERANLTMAEIYVAGEHSLNTCAIAVGLLVLTFYPKITAEDANKQISPIESSKKVRNLASQACLLVCQSPHFIDYFVNSPDQVKLGHLLYITQSAYRYDLSVPCLKQIILNLSEISNKTIFISYDQIFNAMNLMNHLVLKIKNQPVKIDMEFSRAYVHLINLAIGLHEQTAEKNILSFVLCSTINEEQLIRFLPVDKRKIEDECSQMWQDHYARVMKVLNFMVLKNGESSLKVVEKIAAEINATRIIPKKHMLTFKLALSSYKLQMFHPRSKKYLECAKEMFLYYIKNYDIIIECNNHIEKDISILVDLFYTQKRTRYFVKFLSVVLCSLDKDSGVSQSLSLLKAILRHPKRTESFQDLKNTETLSCIKKILFKLVLMKTKQPTRVLSVVKDYCALLVPYHLDIKKTYLEWQFWIDQVSSNEVLKQNKHSCFAIFSYCLSHNKFDHKLGSRARCHQILQMNALVQGNDKIFNSPLELLHLAIHRNLLKDVLDDQYIKMLGSVKRYFNRNLKMNGNVENHSVIFEFFNDLKTILEIFDFNKRDEILKDLIALNIDTINSLVAEIAYDGSEWTMKILKPEFIGMTPHFFTLQMELFYLQIQTLGKDGCHDFFRVFLTFIDQLFNLKINPILKSLDIKKSGDKLWINNVQEKILLILSHNVFDEDKASISEAAILIGKKILSAANQNPNLKPFFKNYLEGVESLILPQESKAFQILKNI